MANSDLQASFELHDILFDTKSHYRKLTKVNKKVISKAFVILWDEFNMNLSLFLDDRVIYK